VDVSAAPTWTARAAPPHAATPARQVTTDPSDGGRFIPGTVLSGRYRIVGLLGRGGMGEVYRADDLKLGQAVALKFLPARLDQDETRLQRLLTEVKIARQISHPGVCRVYDVGEADGHHFISMEYVDGEDLASLLRRIGRLPSDKAVQIARQLCAGLSAAHDQGVLHRDLKPGNVMIDGRGRARISDFGIAAFLGEAASAYPGSGTPAYMAPEQRAGRELTIRSDIYSLGLVLYELFTGQRAFQADTPTELERLQDESTPTSPANLIEGLDPTVEPRWRRERRRRRRWSLPPAKTAPFAPQWPGLVSRSCSPGSRWFSC
jgi:serine/threonine-protein kinase